MLAEGPALSAGHLSCCVGLSLLPQGDREGGKATPGTLAAAHPRLGWPHPRRRPCGLPLFIILLSMPLDRELRLESRIEFLSGLVAVWV